MITNLMFKIEILLGESLKEFLTRKYVQEGLSLRQISNEIEKRIGRKLNKSTFSRYLKRFNIIARQDRSWQFTKIKERSCLKNE